MKRRPLLSFFVLTFGITWGVAAVILTLGDGVLARWLGPLDLRTPGWKAVYHLAVYAPALSAFVVVARLHGVGGVRGFAGRVLRWRVAPVWWAVVLLGYPALRIGSRALANLVAGEDVPLFSEHPSEVLLGFLWTLVDDPGPMEEIGWRGFALPMLQRRMSALAAGSLLGLIWGVWHLPAFSISAMAQSGFHFPTFLAGSVALSLLLTALFNSTRGNVLLAFLVHAIGNFDYGVTEQNTPAGMLTATLLAFGVIGVVWAWRGGETLGRRKETSVLQEGT